MCVVIVVVEGFMRVIGKVVILEGVVLSFGFCID